MVPEEELSGNFSRLMVWMSRETMLARSVIASLRSALRSSRVKNIGPLAKDHVVSRMNSKLEMEADVMV
jgi:hypothetical protein